MPADLPVDAARMAGCGLMIAGGVVPLGLAAGFLSRRRGLPILQRPKLWTVPWSGFELPILFLFAVAAPSSLLDPILQSVGFYSAIYGANAVEADWAPMRPLWSAAIFAPLFVLCTLILAKLAYPNWRPTWKPVAPTVAAAAGTWFVLHPIVAGVHFLVAAAFMGLGWAPDLHPLEKAFHDGRPPVDDLLLVLQAAIATPLVEEFLFRGALLPWLLGRRHRPTLVLVIAAVLATLLSVQSEGGETGLRLGPVVFAAVLLVGGVLHQKLGRKHRRCEGAIYASAALFAVVHSTVWPTPIPLFVLGLGLGWLALRTRGLLAPVLVHGWFNAVSVLFVLRG